MQSRCALGSFSPKTFGHFHSFMAQDWIYFQKNITHLNVEFITNKVFVHTLHNTVRLSYSSAFVVKRQIEFTSSGKKYKKKQVTANEHVENFNYVLLVFFLS